MNAIGGVKSDNLADIKFFAATFLSGAASALSVPKLNSRLKVKRSTSKSFLTAAFPVSPRAVETGQAVLGRAAPGMLPLSLPGGW